MSNIKQFPIRLSESIIARLHGLSEALTGKPRRTAAMVEAWIIECLELEERQLKARRREGIREQHELKS